MKYTKTAIIAISIAVLPSLQGCSDNDNDSPALPEKPSVVPELPADNLTETTVNSDGTTSTGADFMPVDDKTFYIDNIRYSIISDSSIEIEGIDYYESSPIVIPYSKITLNGTTYTVTRLSIDSFRSGFMGESSMTHCSLPQTISELGDYAFERCTKLKEIILPQNITDIPHGCFRYCSSLSKIELPDNIVSIESGAFAHCTSLTEIKLPSRLKVIGSGAFEGCTSLTFINIPEGTEQIGTENEPQGAFNECQNLCTVSLPSTIKSIGEQTFSLCSSLESVTCRAITPPKFHSYAFFPLTREEVMLYVPAEAVDAYTKDIAKLYDAKRIKVMPIP